MDIIRWNHDADFRAERVEVGGLDQPFETADIHDNIVINALEGDGSDHAMQKTGIRGHNVDVLGPDDHVHLFFWGNSPIKSATKAF